MEKDLTLVIMAAGMGSRFGGLKQIEPLGPNKEFIIDYSIYDAKKAGFNKVVFIIKEENYEIFKETIGKRVEPHIKTEYVFQTNKFLKEEYQNLLKDRVKPLGTAHAILCAKEKVDGPFAVINADDFYGRDAYEKAKSYLYNFKEKEYGIVAYRLGNTLTPNGSAKRGVCEVDENNNLIQLTESKVILKIHMYLNHFYFLLKIYLIFFLLSQRYLNQIVRNSYKLLYFYLLKILDCHLVALLLLHHFLILLYFLLIE